MTDEELEALIELLRSALGRIESEEDPYRRAKLAYRLQGPVYEANIAIGPVCQEAILEVRTIEETARRKWGHPDTARLIGSTVTKAASITNKKRGRAEDGDGAAGED